MARRKNKFPLLTGEYLVARSYHKLKAPLSFCAQFGVASRGARVTRPLPLATAKGVSYRGVTLELSVRSRLRTIRRDAEWCDRGGRAPQIESSGSRVGEPALYRRKVANGSKNGMHPAYLLILRLAGVGGSLSRRGRGRRLR